jgi:integrase/recombinase XerC
VTDAVWLLDHLARRGAAQVHELDLAALRSWLAQGRTRGHSRATTARHAASARSFTAWLRRSGLIPEDVGLRLVSPKAHRTLPDVLAPDQARAVVDSTAGAEEPVGLRDAVVLELLYASGIRVSELVGLDVDDVDRSRRLLRVLGKGRKERSVPYGVPAEQALDAWVSGAGGSTRGKRGARCTPRSRRPPELRTSARTGCGTPRPHTSWRGAPTCGRSRSCWATLASPRPRSTRTSPSNVSAPSMPEHIPVLEGGMRTRVATSWTGQSHHAAPSTSTEEPDRA